jgi:hypothetical protein
MLAEIKLAQFQATEEERKKRICRAWERYGGNFPDALKPTKSDPKGDDNIKLNLCRLVVNKGVSFLFGFELGFEIDGREEGAKQTPQEKWLSGCWDANRRMTTLHKLGINGGVSGHTFIKLMAADEAKNGHPFPRLILWDSASVDVRWDPADIDQVISYTYSWHGIDPIKSEPRAFRQVIERAGGQWAITDQTSRLPALLGRAAFPGYGAWETTGEAVWPYPWAPVFDCQNLPAPNEYWGCADLEADVIDTNEDINFTGSNINRILRGHAHPRTFASGMGNGNLELGPDNIALLPVNATLNTLAPVSDMGASLDWYAKLREAFHEVARIPEVATGKVEDLGQLSGLALEILYGPLVELTGTKRLTYGEMLQHLNSRLLELGGQGNKLKVKQQWPQVLPSDKKGEADTALVHEQLGVSKDTLLTKLGYDAEAEAKKKSTEQEADAELGDKLLTKFDRGGNPPPGGPKPTTPPKEQPPHG